VNGDLFIFYVGLGFSPDMMMKERTLADIVDNFYNRGPEIAYVRRCGYRDVRWSYRQVAEAAYQLSAELRARGVKRGDRIFLWGEDCIEWVIAFFGCILCRAVVVPMDRGASPEFARTVCRQVDARLCLCSRQQPPVDSSVSVLTFESFSEVLKPHPKVPPYLPESEAADAVEIVFTSGTTADPKGVVLSHRNILANLEPLESEIGKYLKYERIVHPLRFLNLLPLSHVFGQFLGLFIPQILGGVVIFQDTLNPTEIIRTIKRERVSVLVTVPRIMETLQNKIERDLESKRRLDRFRRALDSAEKKHFLRRWWVFRRIHRQFGWKFWAFISGGASLGAETEKFWGRLGFAVIQGYGLTETTSMISLNHPMRLGKGSIGKVMPGREVKLADDGEILVRGESIAKSYFQGNEMKPVAGKEGWFPTGDMGVMDEKGNLYFKGRRKNVIVSPEGMNIYPEDLEKALRNRPEVKDCVVLGLERDGNAEACAVLLLDKGQDPEPVVRQANQSLAEYQQIRRWVVWPDEDFPRTATQKPQTKLIREFIDSHFRGTEAAAGSGMLIDMIARITGRRIDHLSEDSNLSGDLNLSSIERVELLSALEDRFQVDLNESRFTSASTVGDLERMLSRPAQHRTDFHYPRWAQSRPVALIRIMVYYLLSLPATLLMAWPRIKGRENLRNLRGPLLLICNHVTQVDVGFVLAALPRLRHRLAVAMWGELLQAMRNPPENMPFIKRFIERISYGLVVALFNVFPLPQQTGFRESFAFAGELADRGYSILVFPEGMRTKDGNLSPFKAGIGLLAANLNLPVVPIRIDGLYELKKKNKKFSRPGTVVVTVGSALRINREADPMAIAQELEIQMERLSHEKNC
jgi:long-chain acyl-CoA synthetase